MLTFLHALTLCTMTLLTCIGALFYGFLFLVASPILYLYDVFRGYDFFYRMWSTMHSGNGPYFAITGFFISLLLCVNYYPLFIQHLLINTHKIKHFAISLFKKEPQAFSFACSEPYLEINKYYVYGHFLSGEKLPFYIGKGTGKRAIDFKRSVDWQKYIMEKQKSHTDIVVRLHSFHDDEGQALQTEKDLIKHFQPTANKLHK